MPNNYTNCPWPVGFNMAVNQNNMTMQAPASFEMAQTQDSANSFMAVPVPVENMYGVVGMGNYCPYGMMPPQENMLFPSVKKEIVQLSNNSVLYPQNPNVPLPTTREKPLGCKTVFVGGLPEKVTEEIIKEIFERCGLVETIRMSKKNFCHVRFAEESSIENAIYFSGYRLKIENKDDAAYTGKLHVDYAQARDDQYEFECKQRFLQRQARHQEYEFDRPVTPPVVHYTDHEASLICEKLNVDETFPQAANILITWFERGECNKRTASTFFSMIQATKKRVRNLLADKTKCEEQATEAKRTFKNYLGKIIHQFTEIGKIYEVACLQKCWDQFTKAQRKNIEMWKSQLEELKNAHMEEVIHVREDEEMELSDDENNENKTTTDGEQLKGKLKEEFDKLQEERDSLRSKLEAIQKKMEELQSNHKEELKQKDNQLAATREAFQNSQKQVLNLSQKCTDDDAELQDKCAFKRKRKDDVDLTHNSNNVGLGSNINPCYINGENEARLIGVISTFLNVHPFGANIDYICSYLHQIDSSINARDIENLMKRFPSVFREDSTGIGASLGRKWFYRGFNN